jgi:hypothetical protein
MDYRERLKYQYGGVQFPEYESMYVDLKRPEIAQGLSDRYDANKAEYDTLQRAIGSVQTLEGDKYAVQDLANRVEGNMSGIVNSGAYEFGAMAVSDSVTDFMTDQNVLDSVKSWENRQKELEVIAERRANGLQTYDFGQVPVIDPATGMAMRDPATGEVITQHVSDTHVTANQGVYQPLSENKLPAEEKARQLMQGIRDDPILLGRIQSTDPELAFFLRSGKAVTADKIESVAKAVLPLYMDSAEGLQKMRALQQIIVNDAGTLYTPQEAQQVLLKDLISAAAPQQGTDYQYTQSALMKALADQETVTGTPVEPRQSVSPDSKYEEIDFDDYFDGDNLYSTYATGYDPEFVNSPEGQEVLKNSYATPEAREAAGIEYADESLKRVRKQLAEGKDLLNIRGNTLGKLQYLMEEYGDKIPRLPGQTNKEYAKELWNGIVKNPAIQIDTVYAPRQGGMEGMLKVLGNAPNLQVIDIDNPTTVPLSLQKWADEIADPRDFWDIDEDWAKEIKLALQGGGSGSITEGGKKATVQINGLTTRGPLAGGIELVYTPSDGDPFRLIVADKSKPLAQFKRIGAVSDLVAQGKPNATKRIEYPKPTKTGDPITDAEMPRGITHIDYTYKVRRNPDHGNVESYVLVEYKNSRTNKVYKAIQRTETLGAVVQGILDNSAKRGEELGLLFSGTKQPRDLTVKD